MLWLRYAVIDDYDFACSIHPYPSDLMMCRRRIAGYKLVEYTNDRDIQELIGHEGSTRCLDVVFSRISIKDESSRSIRSKRIALDCTTGSRINRRKIKSTCIINRNCRQ